MEPTTPDSATASTSSRDGWLGILSPEVATAQETVARMKQDLYTLGTVFDSIGSQTAHIGLVGGDMETTRDLNDLGTLLREQQTAHQEGMHEIKLLLADVMQRQIMEHLTECIDKEIEQVIDDLVKEEVARCLQSHIPQELQDEVESVKRQLEEAKKDLHNSESRRANATLRETDQNMFLHTIYTPAGEVSPLYPKTLSALFKLDLQTSKQLMLDYNITEVSESKERNLNRILQFCGVSYQVVRTGNNTRRVGVYSERPSHS